MKLTGTPISNCQETTALLSSDTFLVSKQAVQGLNAYQSMGIDLRCLENDIIDKLRDKYRLGTMAFENESDYSIADHSHNYNKIEFIGTYPGNDKIKIGRITIIGNSGSQSHEIYVKKKQMNVGTYPEIGEIRFVPYGVRQKSISSPDFDGWVSPNGASYNKSDFPDAYEVFGTTNETTFTVPNLNHFVKCGSDFQEHIEEITPIKEHSHSVQDMEFNSGQTVGVVVNVGTGTNTTAGGNGCHSIQADTCNLSNTKIHKTTIGMTVTSIKFDSLTVGDQSNSTKTHPRYNNLPVQIYIGKKVSQ